MTRKALLAAEYADRISTHYARLFARSAGFSQDGIADMESEMRDMYRELTLAIIAELREEIRREIRER